MENLEKNIELSKDELFAYLNNSSEFQDLTKQFNELYHNSPEIYEIIMLVYQEFQTRDKINKRKITNIMNLNIKSKTKLLAILQTINLDMKHLRKDVDRISKHETWTNKLKRNLTFTNVSKAIGLFIFILLFLALLQSISPVVFNELIDVIHSANWFDKTKDIK